MENKKSIDYVAGLADGYFNVGDLLKYEYEGSWDRESIEDFFDDKATDLLIKYKPSKSQVDKEYL